MDVYDAQLIEEILDLLTRDNFRYCFFYLELCFNRHISMYRAGIWRSGTGRRIKYRLFPIR